MDRRIPHVLGLVTLLVSAVACTQRPGAAGSSVLMIVVDTLRADRIGSYGYARPTSPHLDRFAAEGVRFANARATSSWTLPSVASIMTGLYPAVHGAEQSDSVLSQDLDTMAQAFSDAGYATAAFSANPAFVTPRQGLARGFDQFEVLHGESTERDAAGAVPADASLMKWVLEAKAEQVTSTALEWIAARDATKPFFAYVHYFDPHAAYTPPAEYARRFGVDPDDPLSGRAQWPHLLAPDAPTPSVLSTLSALYDAEIAATDAAIGRLIDSLPERVRESTFIVVTSDHGEEFGEHGGIQHGRTLFDELLRVPLLLGGPGLPRGKVVQAPVTLAALRSTLADLTRIEGAHDEIEPSFAARLVGEPSAPAPVFADLESRFAGDRRQHRRALVEGRWKLLLDPERVPHLYDLEEDRQEQRDLALDPDAEQRTADFRSRILDRDAEAVRRRAVAPPARVILDPAKREQLKALGYLQ